MIKLGLNFIVAFLVSPIRLYRCVLRSYHFGNRAIQVPPRQRLALPAPPQLLALLGPAQPLPLPAAVPPHLAPVQPLPLQALAAAQLLRQLPAVAHVAQANVAQVPVLINVAPVPVQPNVAPVPVQPNVAPVQVGGIGNPYNDDDDDDAAATPRRRRRTELEMLTDGIQTPALDRSLRLRQEPQRLQFDHSTPRRVVRNRSCRDCKTRLENLLKNL